MIIVGSPVWVEELLPDYDQYLPELLGLAIDVWSKVDLSGLEKILEPNITALFAIALRDEIQKRKNIPFLCFPEIQDFDLKNGKQLTRSDIEFHPNGVGWNIDQQKPYLVLESKCLRVTHQNTFRANTSEYLKETLSFVNDTKFKHPAFCAMVGYIMDGQVSDAFDALQNALNKSKNLGLSPHHCITVCTPMPHPPHGQTEHISKARKSGEVTIYHLLFSSPVPHLQT